VLRRGLAGAAVLAALPLLAACSGGGGSGAGAAKPTAPAYDATVRTAKCVDWKTASSTEQHQLVAGMRAFFGGQVDEPGERGQVLANANAITLFNDYCARSFADNFSLYRIYGNAAGFAPPTSR
jgi:hypothetical protein